MRANYDINQRFAELLRESQQVSQGAGYHSAKNATMEDLHQDIQQETMDTIANLATASTAD